MVSGMLDAPMSLQALAMVLVVFGVAPSFVLRFMTLAFHPEDPRRAELRAELHAVPTWERPIWVAQQLEIVLFDGLRDRIEWGLTGHVIHRWELGDGVKMNADWPTTFWIPADEDKAAIRPGHHVKLAFQMRPGYQERDGWGERMWVEVSEVRGNRFKGQLFSQPVGIPKLYAGESVDFSAKHIIDVVDPRDDE